jgi:hypothetical protein
VAASWPAIKTAEDVATNASVTATAIVPHVKILRMFAP